MSSEVGGLGFIPSGNEHLARLNSGARSSRKGDERCRSI
jgi:hypothetical protein